MTAATSFALLALLSAPTDSGVLEFVSRSCVHCQAMQPLVSRLAAEGVPIQVVDANQQADLVQQFGVTGVPTFVAVSGGREVGRIVGATSAEKLVELAKAVEVRSQKSEVRSPPSGPPEQSARAASVRLKVEDATGYGFGTGTIIDVHDGEALVMTCGHLFRESKGKGKVTADVFATGKGQTVEGQLVSYDLERDIALVSIHASGMRPASVAPPGRVVLAGEPAFTVGCDKGADPSVRATQITAVNKYRGRPNYTAAGQPVDGRSGGGLFTADGYLIGVCNAADPQDNEGIYAGLASIHWQLDYIGQSEIYQRSAQVAASAPAPRDASVALALAQAPVASLAAAPPTSPEMPATFNSALSSGAPTFAPVAAGDDTEIVFVVRSKRDPSQRSEVYVVDQAAPDLVARITHAARASGEQRAALARAGQPAARTAAISPPATSAPVVRGQSSDY